MHTHTSLLTNTQTHRTNMTNTWYKLFNIISTHKKRTCILSCSVRSLTITHAGTYFARNDNNYTTLLIFPFSTSQSLQQTKTEKKKGKENNNNCHHSFQLNSKCIKMHFSASKDRKKFQCKLTEDIFLQFSTVVCYVQNLIQTDIDL